MLGGRRTGSRGNCDTTPSSRSEHAPCKRNSTRAGEAKSPAGRARLAALDDEKLQTYQQRYEEYVRIGNGLRRGHLRGMTDGLYRTWLVIAWV